MSSFWQFFDSQMAIWPEGQLVSRVQGLPQAGGDLDLELSHSRMSLCSQMGQMWDFLRSVSVNFASPRQKVQELILKWSHFGVKLFELIYI